MKIIGLVLFLAGAVPAQAQAGQLKSLTFGKDVQSREARAWEYDKVSTEQSHSDFQFKIDNEAKVVGQQVQIQGTLTNTAPMKKTVYVVGDKETLLLQIPGIKKRSQKAPVPPPMFAIEVPAKSEIRFTGAQNLDELEYDGSPDVKIKWTFQYWTSPKPSGEISFKMPTAQEAKVIPLKITFQKFSAEESSKLIASLLNVSNDPQIFCKSSQVNFYWDLAHQDGSKIDDVERMNVDYLVRPMTESDCFILKPNESKEVATATINKVKDAYEFITEHATYKNLKKAQYQVHFSALNSAVHSDVAERLKAKAKAAEPTQNIEVTNSISIP